MYNTRIPQIGEHILFFANSDDTIALSNGKRMGDPVAAIVTQAWSAITVNLKLIPDHAAMQDRGSVCHKTAMPGGVGYYWLFPEEYYTEEREVSKVASVRSKAEKISGYFSERIAKIDNEIERAKKREEGDYPMGTLVTLLEELKGNYEADIAYLTDSTY